MLTECQARLQGQIKGLRIMYESLPTKRDFVTHPADLDQNCAWEHFGGLTRDEATARFAENPLLYQEDFMFMGTGAFLYYFPVVVHHLRTTPDQENDDDGEAWILAQCIRAQFESAAVDRLRPLIPRVVDLARFVRDNIRRFGEDTPERERVARAWAELRDYLQSLGNA